METLWSSAVSRQLDAVLTMLARSLRACPDSQWEERLWDDPSMPGLSAFWYLAYHTLFWTDLYLGGQLEGFAPPAPFTLAELDPAGLLPERVYTRAELLDYLEHCRAKARQSAAGLTAERAARICRFGWGEMPYAELLLDILRHAQEHTAQLNMFLGQKAGTQSRWVTIPRD